MNRLERNKSQETLRRSLALLPAPTKLFLVFNVLAFILAVSSGTLFALNEASALSGLVEACLVFAIIYILIASLVINLGFAYQERNITAATIPLLMATIGLLMSFWLYDEYLGDQLDIISLAIAGAAVVLIPVIGFSLSRSVSIKARKVYAICFWQIISTALFTWFAFSLFI